MQTEVLFQPFAFGNHQIKNRIVMAPMTRQHSPQGVPGEDVARYYRRRAEGGVGLIITEGTYIDHPAANGYANVPAFFGEEALAGWKRVVEEVHAAGGKIIPQLWHVGPTRRPGLEPDPQVPGFGPMQLADEGKTVVKQMTKDDIKEAAASFARAARDAEKIGFDGIELHGAHGYLIDSFLWEGANRRNDEYGGSLENRVRFAVEVVKAVRATVKPDFPVVFRFSQWKASDYSARIVQNPEELKYFLDVLVAAGVDVFHVSTRRFWEPAFAGSDEILASLTRRLSGKPVIAVGSVGLSKEFAPGKSRNAEDMRAEVADIQLVKDKMKNNEFDLVAVGRALLSEPDWAKKVSEGRIAEIKEFDKSALTTLVV